MHTLFGIKNCDTVKEARRWLEEHNVSYEFYDIREIGLNEAQVKGWVNELGLEALVNKRSKTWKGLDEATRHNFNEDSAVRVIIANPTLIKRPLLDSEDELYVGFDHARYADIFSQFFKL